MGGTFEGLKISGGKPTRANIHARLIWWSLLKKGLFFARPLSWGECLAGSPPVT